MSERKRSSKIEKLGLTERILEANAQGVTALDLAAQLNAEGIDINQSTISRWLKKQRDTAQPEVGRLVRAHVEKTVPADLDALEEMEAKCLKWARESNLDISHRLAAQHIEAQFVEWTDLIQRAAAAQQNTGDDFAKDAVRTIMSKCLLWIADEVALQKKSISAMRMAAQIIDLKLKYSGIIDGAASGNIFFTDQQAETGKSPKLEGKENNLFVVRGNKD